MKTSKKETRTARKSKTSESEALIASMTSKQRDELLLQMLQERTVASKSTELPVGAQTRSKIAETHQELFGNTTQVSIAASTTGTPKKAKGQGELKIAPSVKIARTKFDITSQVSPSESISNASRKKLKSKSKVTILKVAQVKDRRRKQQLEQDERNWIDVDEEDFNANQPVTVYVSDNEPEGKLNSEEESNSNVLMSESESEEDRSEKVSGRSENTRNAKPPSHYDGTRDQTVVSTFFYQLENWFSLCMVPNKKKCLHLSNLISGIALKWYMSVNRITPFTSYELAKQAMLKEFCPDLANDTARNRLENLFCGKSFVWFLNRFRDICLEIDDMSPNEKFYTFRRKLPDEFRIKVIEKECTDFDSAVAVCNKLAMNVTKLSITTNKTNGSKKDAKDLKNNAILKGNKDDRKKGTVKHKNYDNVQRLTLAERDRRLKDKLCLNCGCPDCRAHTCEKDFKPHQ